MKTNRQSNIELLRIISMFLIVCNHFSIHGVDIKNATLTISINKIFADIVSAGGKLGAIAFILISGYYLINSRPSTKRIKSILGTMWLYSVLFFIIQMVVNPHKLSFSSILQSIFPFLYNGYWFMTAYILLMIFVPYLNKLLHSLNQNEFKKLLYILIFITLLLPTIFPKSLAMISEFPKFITFYITGAYLQQFNLKWDNRKFGEKICLISTLLLITSIVLINGLGWLLHSQSIAAHATYFSQNLSIVPFIIALGLFIWMKNINIGSIQWINKISGTTLGIYLIHENIFVRNYIWSNIFSIPHYMSGSIVILIIIFLVSTISIFIVCSLIEFLRQWIVNKTFK